MTYIDLIVKAIKADGDRKGSSLQAIKKGTGVDAAKFRFINAALKSGVEKGTLVKNKGRYKLSAAAKKPAKKTTKRKASTKKGSKKTVKKAKVSKKKTATKKKPATKKKAATKKKTVTKKKPAKKKAPAKAKKASKK